MIAPGLLLAACLLPGQASDCAGHIDGLVLNGSRNAVPCQATIVLRVRIDGELLVLREVASDEHGKFAFEQLPLGEQYEYLPGANRDGVHYPGARLHLSHHRPQATVTLTVHDSSQGPNPLVVRRHRIAVEPAEGVLTITESMLVENPADICYVGHAERKDAVPITLQLRIPADFERITFAEEFFGRRFALVDGKLATGIPWPPGQKEIAFKYVLRNAQRQRNWQRTLDLPCDDLRLCVSARKGEDVRCNLGTASAGIDGTLLFQSTGKILPAGYAVNLELGHLPVSWLGYARWLSPGVLLVLVGLGWLIARQRRQDATGGRQGTKNKMVALQPVPPRAAHFSGQHRGTGKRGR